MSNRPIDYVFTDNDIKKFTRCLELEKGEIVKQFFYNNLPTQYLITSHGRIISTRYRGVYGVTSFLLQKIQLTGYKSIMLVINTTHKTFLVHRLVALTFIDNPDHKPEVNHKDGNKCNNNITNLEWSTKKENIQHAFKNNLHPILKGELIANSKYKEYQVINVCKFLEQNKLSIKDISERTGISKEMILRIKDGISWKHISKNYKIENYNFGISQQDKSNKENAIRKASDMLSSKKYKLKDIAEATGISITMLERIKNGTAYKNILA